VQTCHSLESRLRLTSHNIGHERQAQPLDGNCLLGANITEPVKDPDYRGSRCVHRLPRTSVRSKLRPSEAQYGLFGKGGLNLTVLIDTALADGLLRIEPHFET